MNDLISTLIALSGQDDVIVVHRSFVAFTGSMEAAMMLNQLLYWTPRTQLTIDGKGNWIARSDDDWSSELMLTSYAVRQARKQLEKMGLLETTLKKFAGTPKVHYCLNMETLSVAWADFAKTQSPLCENTESSIETYIETYKDLKKDTRPKSSDLPLLPDFQETDKNKQSVYKEMLDAWSELFPEKPQPRSNTESLRLKVTTRIKSPAFLEKWHAAMERASKSTFCQGSGWFDFGWFVQNDTNYEKCLNGKYDDKKSTSAAKKPTRTMTHDQYAEWAKTQGISG